jgi:hypothetical protein
MPSIPKQQRGQQNVVNGKLNLKDEESEFSEVLS